MSAIVVCAKIRASNPVTAEKVHKHLQAIRDYAVSDKEPGTKLYYPTRGNEDELQFFVFEEYDNEEAMKAHMNGPVFLKFAAEVGDLLDGGHAGLELAYHHQI